MIDIINTATCKTCNKPITQTGKGPRKREYCSNACKERAYRERKAALAQPTLEQQTIAALQEKLSAAGARILKLERQVEVQRSRLGELETDKRRLQAFIDQLRDIEEAFRTDTRMQPFKRFLASSPYHAARPGCVKILDPEAGFVPRGSRGTYTDIMRRAGMSLDEQADIWAAWRDMLKDELFKSYDAARGSNP